MKKVVRTKSILVVQLATVFSLLLGLQPVSAAVPYPASDVLGQLTSSSPDFTTYDTNDISAPNALGLNSPQDIAIDPVAHKLFIVERLNSRVVVHNLDSSNNLIDKTADNVFGQSDLTSNGDVTTQSGLDRPTGVAVDTTNSLLFVADTDNNRVMIFDYTSITNGENAVNVFGQAAFNTSTSATSATGMSAPASLAFDPATNYLYVGQTGSQRISVFDTTAISDGESAVNVLGAPDFTTTGSGLTAAEIGSVEALAIDSSGQRLFAADDSRNRVLVYDIASISDGENAVNVLGASDFTTTGETTASQSSVYRPNGLAYDSTNDRLYVSQRNDRRVTVFDVASITDGENATNVLGQANFTATGYNSSPQKSIFPERIAYNGNKLYVANSSSNNRVEIFDVATITNGESISDLLGQTDGSGNANYLNYGPDDQHPNRVGLSGPSQMVVDETKHRLYISEQYNNRVVVHNLSATNELIDYQADAVLGQPSMVSKECYGGIGNDTASQAGLCNPSGLALDTGRQLLYVADTSGSRVIVYNVATVTTGENAVNVLGQPNYTSTTNALTAAGLRYPTHVEFAKDRNLLFVSDYLENRVLVYDVATLSNGENAIYVLGQPDFTTNNDGVTTQASLDRPVASTYDATSKYLFVSDETNARVMVFDTTTLANGMNATRVLGQPDFVTSTFNSATASTIATPGYSAVDKTSRVLYMWDYSRILVFDIASVTNNESAVGVIGQSDLTSESLLSPSQTTIEGGYGLFFAPLSAKLYASDIFYERMLVYDLAQITTSSLPSAEAGTAYTKTLSKADAQGTTTYSLASGSLPSGITLSSGGVISGTTTAEGAYPIIVKITDSNGAAGTFMTTRKLTLNVTGQDDDSDGVEDSVEDGGPNGGDANGDGTPDSDQNDVSTNENSVGGGYTTVESSSGVIENFSILDESTLPTQSSEDFPLGLNDFAVSGLTPGASADVTIYYDQEYDTSDWVFMKYSDATETYTDISSIVTYGTQDVGGTTVTTVTYSLTDGGDYDEDGIANGTIVDPTGPSFVAGATDPSAPDTGFAAHTNPALISALLLVVSGTLTLKPAFVFHGRRKK